MALHFAREGVQVAGARVPWERGPGGRRGIGGGDGGGDVRLAALRHARQDGFRRGIDRLEVLAFGGLDPAAVDEVAEASVVVLPEPLQRRRVALGRRPILHRFEQFGDGRHHTIGWRCAAA